MADNIIKRIIQLVLDKDSAKKTQSDADAVASHVDTTWKSVAGKIAGYLTLAFVTDKIIGFGKAAVKEAAESEATWRALKGTIDNTGESFDAMEKKLRAVGNAFQDATIHDDDAFAESLTRLITLTGDTDASLNNMALVANVAAQFFKGDLEPATNLVAKAMNGNVLALQKMGIHATSAQGALEILAQRSMGAATREASTFSGQLSQMDEQWKDVLKDMGNAIISSDGTTDSIKVLRAAMQQLSIWIADNKDNIQRWVTDGVKFAIDAADVFIRAVEGMGRALTGGFLTSIGLAAQGVAILVRGLATLADVDADLDSAVGNIERLSKDTDRATRLKAQADSIDAWGKSVAALGTAQVQKGIDVLSTPKFGSDQFAKAPKTAPAALGGEGNKPQVGKNLSDDDTKAVEKAIKDFNEAAKAAQNMKMIIGDSFDDIGADIDRSTKLLDVFASKGIDPATKGFTNLGAHLSELTNFTQPFDEAQKKLNKTLGTDGILAIAMNQSAIERLTAEQQAYKQEIQDLADAKIPATNIAVISAVDAYNKLTDAIREAQDIQKTADVFQELGDDIRSGLFEATLDAASALDTLTMKQTALRKSLIALHALHKDDTKDFKDIKKQYDDVTGAIVAQTTAMQLQAAAADFLADALGAALAGGLKEAAAKKAKENAVMALEMLVRAATFAVFQDYPHATASLVLAAQYGAVAAGWAALSSASGGSGGGGSTPSISASPTSSTSSGSSDVSDARQTSSQAATASQTPSAEVSIYLTGPGFDALNPAVQRVVWGASQQAAERYGPNARVRVLPKGDS